MDNIKSSFDMKSLFKFGKTSVNNKIYFVVFVISTMILSISELLIDYLRTF